MSWKVLLFAHLREKHGESVQVQADPSVDAVMKSLTEAGLDIRSCRLAADNEFMRPGEPLQEGAELALIPPVSGG
jgi:molybdopterin converting factor small subunit